MFWHFKKIIMNLVNKSLKLIALICLKDFLLLEIFQILREVFKYYQDFIIPAHLMVILFHYYFLIFIIN